MKSTLCIYEWKVLGFRLEEVTVTEILHAAVRFKSYTSRQKPWGNCKIERLAAETVGGGNIDTGSAAWFRFISEIQKGHKTQLIMKISRCHVIHSNNWKLIKFLYALLAVSSSTPDSLVSWDCGKKSSTLDFFPCFMNSLVRFPQPEWRRGQDWAFISLTWHKCESSKLRWKANQRERM